MLVVGSEAPRTTRARVYAALVGRVRVFRPPQRGRRKGTWRARARQDAFFKVPLERDQLTRRVALPPLGRLARGLGQSKIRHSGPSYDLSGEVCTHERAPRGLHTRGPGSHEALPSPQPTSHTERNHARLVGKAALLKPLSGGKHRAHSMGPVPHRTTAAVPAPLDPATRAGPCTPVRQRASARTPDSALQPRRRPAAAGPRPPTSACTMLVSGSLASAPRTCAAVGTIELSVAQSAPRQRQPSAVRKPWSPSAGVSRGARVAHANERSRRQTSPEPRRLGFKLPDFALGRGREGGTFSLIIVFLRYSSRRYEKPANRARWAHAQKPVRTRPDRVYLARWCPAYSNLDLWASQRPKAPRSLPSGGACSSGTATMVGG